MPLIRIIVGVEQPGPWTVIPQWCCLIAGSVILIRKFNE
jgi:hypothetical protein